MGLRQRSAGSGTDGAATDAVVGAARAARKPFTAARAKRLIGVGKAVAPLLAPYALAAAGVVRSQWDARRAARLGVEPGQIAKFSGPGGALHARISRIAETLDRLESGAGIDGTGITVTDEARRFVADTRPRLADLAVAVRAAEQMPSARRRTAYRAVGGELDRVEVELLTRLGVLR
jgi:Family of unknown function (DUF6474)